MHIIPCQVFLSTPFVSYQLSDFLFSVINLLISVQLSTINYQTFLQQGKIVFFAEFGRIYLSIYERTFPIMVIVPCQIFLSTPFSVISFYRTPKRIFAWGICFWHRTQKSGNSGTRIGEKVEPIPLFLKPLYSGNIKIVKSPKIILCGIDSQKNAPYSPTPYHKQIDIKWVLYL